MSRTDTDTLRRRASPRAAGQPGAQQTRQGLWLGVLGVTIFALTLPLTRIAVGTPDAPQLSGVFVATGRAAVAALLSLPFLWFTRAPWPRRADWRPLGMVALGVVFGFPLFTSIAMRHVQAVHASVMLGVLPLATAVVGAYLHRQRPSLRFWCCAVFGALLVVIFSVLSSGLAGLQVQSADLLLLAAMACAATGYAWGARLSGAMRAEHVICWALLLTLPINLPLAYMQWPDIAIKSIAWWAFAYVAVFSMWLGFFAWYRALALGGTVRVSQVQLMQPILSMLFAVPLLGESLDATTVGFGLAVMATVLVGRRMPVRTLHQGTP